MYTQITVNDIKENEVLLKVWDLVNQAHAGQMRKGLLPTCHHPEQKPDTHPEYVTHPFRAMEIVANALGNPKEVLKDQKNIPIFAAALAHDMIEDTPLNTETRLVAALIPIMGFQNARRTAHLVQELSNPPEGFPGETKQERDAAKKVWQSEHAKTMSVDAKIVKMADQIANTIDSVDLFMSKPDGKGGYEDIWTKEKKDSYVEKAAAVCSACLVGTETAPEQKKEVFKKLERFEKDAYNYAQMKIENPMLCFRDFFRELEDATKVPDMRPFNKFLKPSKTR